MKTPRTYLILILLIFNISAKAQTFMGLSGGGGIDNMVSLRASLPLEFAIGKHLVVRSGAVFTQQHNNEILLKLDPQRDYRLVTLSYIGVPVILKAGIPFQSFQAYGLVGPQVNYGISMSTTYIEEGFYGSEKLNFEELAIKHWDIGLNVGIGLEKEIRNGSKIFAEMLLLINFLDIDKKPENEIFNEGKVFNLGVLFPLDKH